MPTLYLSADIGNDAGNGSKAAPFLTVAKAHDMATSGDTVVCLDSASNYVFTSQTFTKALTVRAETSKNSRVVFDAAALMPEWKAQANLTVDGLTFQNVDSGGNWSGGFVLIDVDNLTVKILRCTFRDFVTGGRDYFGGFGLIYPDFISSRDNIDVTFSNNLVLPSLRSNDQTLGRGIYVNLGRLTNSIIRVDGNTIHNSDQYDWRSMGAFINAGGTTNTAVYVRNNILYSEDDWPMNFVYGHETLTSIVSQNNTRYGVFNNIPATDTGALTTNPMFVDKANSNYSLRPTSPSMDSGVEL